MNQVSEQIKVRMQKLRDFAGTNPNEDWFTRGELEILESVLNITYEDLED